MFPELELSNGGTFAVIITLSNTWRIYRVKPINGSLFYVPDLGTFQLDAEYRYTFGRSEIYFFEQQYSNALSFRAKWELAGFLQNKKKSALDMGDIAKFVDKIRKVEAEERALKETIDAIIQSPNGSKNELVEMINEGQVDALAQRIADREKPDLKEMSEYTQRWINAFHHEDAVVRYSMIGKILAENHYRIKASLPVIGILPQRTIGKRNIGVFVINNKIIKIDPYVKVELNTESGYNRLKSNLYGDFDITDTTTRYRYGKTNLYVMLLGTKDFTTLTGAIA